MVPSILAISQRPFGRRASNNSATRGRPPVMSFVFAACAASWPSTWAPRSSRLLHDDVRPPESGSWRGFASLVVHNDDLRMQVFLVLDDDHGFLLPVVSSTSCFIVTPSMMSTNFTDQAFGDESERCMIPDDEGFTLLDLPPESGTE